jgi:hypothetical protein
MNRLLSLALMSWLVGGLASAASFEGTQVTRTLVRSGKNLKGEARETFSLTSEIYRVAVRREVVAERVWDCEDDVPADGTRGDWKGFFNATKEDKPYRLAEAVRGIGVETARRLVEDNYFNSKPRSWSEFKKRLWDADQEYQTGFYHDAVVTYGQENALNLGYIVEGQCGYKTVLVERFVPVRTFVRNEVRQYQVRVQNAPLLVDESEKITITFDGVEDSIYVSSPYNDYKVERWNDQGTVVFDLAGARKQVRPGNSLSLNASVNGGKLSVSVADSAFDAEVQEDRFLVGKVQVDRGGWRGNLDVGTFEKPLSKDSSQTVITDVGLEIPANQNLVIYYELRIGSSRYHNGQASSSKKLKLKRN